MADQTYIYVGAEASGLYRKEANDDHWEELTDGMPPSPQAWPIAINSKNSEVVFVGTQRGVYRSNDRGDHWERMDMLEGRIVRSLRFHPSDPQIMYLGTEGNDVFRSDDGGETWQHLANISTLGAHQMPFVTRVLGLAIERTNPDVMFAGLEVGGAARSLDGGNTWEIMNRQFAGNMGLLDLHGVEVASPQSDAVFIPNRLGVWRSRDRGENWENCHLEAFSNNFYCRGVRVAPDDPNTLYAAIGANFRSIEGSVLRTTNLGETWHQFDRGVDVRGVVFGVAINEKHPEQIYFCTRFGQVFGTEDNGASWSEQPPLPESAQRVLSVACTSS
jgi:photosystem II stability/assembly factor-like uncharacterized protein